MIVTVVMRLCCRWQSDAASRWTSLPRWHWRVQMCRRERGWRRWGHCHCVCTATAAVLPPAVVSYWYCYL